MAARLVFTKRCPVCEKEMDVIVYELPQVYKCPNPNCETVLEVILDVSLKEYHEKKNQN